MTDLERMESAVQETVEEIGPNPALVELLHILEKKIRKQITLQEMEDVLDG